MKNGNLHAARTKKNDEFYTQLSDIEKELRFFKNTFKGKTVLCNCDDPKESKFWEHFSGNFEFLGLKKLIATHYAPGRKSYKLELTTAGETKTQLEGDGDFRSPECVELLNEADIVVTNPPFSLFREYISQLVNAKKKFVIIGSMNAITYRDVFGFIKKNQVWAGHTHPKEFLEPSGERKKFGNIGWFTNIATRKRTELLPLGKKYKGNETEYPEYDGYSVIEVNRIVNIPEDYPGVMGVPITFLKHYNPDQFLLFGQANSARWLFKECYTIVEGRKIYNRLLIQHKHPKL